MYDQSIMENKKNLKKQNLIRNRNEEMQNEEVQLNRYMQHHRLIERERIN